MLAYKEAPADQPLTPGMSPIVRLRRIRLDHVHAELLRRTSPEVCISDIAMRFHPSRCVRQYHERFGELLSHHDVASGDRGTITTRRPP